MQTKKPHIARRLFVSVLAMQILLLPLFCVVSITAVKKMQRRLMRENSRDMVTLTLSGEEFDKLVFVEDDEVFFNNTLYDIKSIKKEGQNYLIRALADEKEASLLKIMARKEGKNKSPQKHRLKVPLLFIENAGASLLMPFKTDKNCLSSNPITTSSLYLKIPTPPPEPVV